MKNTYRKRVKKQARKHLPIMREEYGEHWSLKEIERILIDDNRVEILFGWKPPPMTTDQKDLADLNFKNWSDNVYNYHSNFCNMAGFYSYLSRSSHGGLDGN